MKTMGTWLKELRMNAGYTGEEVGRMLQVSKSAISMWEKDLRSPSADLIERFADIYGVSTDYIITGRESNAPKGYITTRRLPSMQSIYERGHTLKYYSPHQRT